MKKKGKDHHCYKHGHNCSNNPSKIYKVWSEMRQRTENPKNAAYLNYGKRGIAVCKEWKDAATFIDWALNNGYREGLELNRINNDGNYCPSNCNFVTHAENNHNKRLRKDWGISRWRKYYRVRIQIFGVSFCKYRKTLEDAREAKIKILENYEDLRKKHLAGIDSSVFSRP